MTVSSLLLKPFLLNVTHCKYLSRMIMSLRMWNCHIRRGYVHIMVQNRGKYSVWCIMGWNSKCRYLFLSVAEEVCIHSVTCRPHPGLYVWTPQHRIQTFSHKVGKKNNRCTTLYSLHHPEHDGERIVGCSGKEKEDSWKGCAMQSNGCWGSLALKNQIKLNYLGFKVFRV